MRLRIYVFFTCLLLFACSGTKDLTSDDLMGKFYAKNLGYTKGTFIQYTLELKSDNVFYFEITGHDYSPSCEGIWRISNDTLLLKCEESANSYEMLSSGYMNEREHKLQINSKNKMKYKDASLKRKK